MINISLLASKNNFYFDRMDELDHMYDDMQDRLFEIDKNR